MFVIKSFQKFLLGTSIILISSTTFSANIEGIDRVLLLQKLHQHAKPMGRDYRIDIPTPTIVSAEAAAPFIGQNIGFFEERLIKMKIPREGEGNEVDTSLYNRENGEGLAEKIIASLRKEGNIAFCKFLFKSIAR